MLEYSLRFLAGGIAVSAFAALCAPKASRACSAPLPRIALATLLITLSQNGAPFVALEGRSMIAGAAGVIAARLGPVIGGLFLAFSRDLSRKRNIGFEKHVRERKEKAGLPEARRGKEAAALDAAGAVLGSFGLAAFGLVIWQMIMRSGASALVLAAASWLAVALFAWRRRWL